MSADGTANVRFRTVSDVLAQIRETSFCKPLYVVHFESIFAAKVSAGGYASVIKIDDHREKRKKVTLYAQYVRLMFNLEMHFSKCVTGTFRKSSRVNVFGCC